MSLSLKQCRKLQAAGCPGAEVENRSASMMTAVEIEAGGNTVYSVKEPTVEEMMTWLGELFNPSNGRQARLLNPVILEYIPGCKLYHAVFGGNSYVQSDDFPSPLSALYDLFEKLEAGK